MALLRLTVVVILYCVYASILKPILIDINEVTFGISIGTERGNAITTIYSYSEGMPKF